MEPDNAVAETTATAEKQEAQGSEKIEKEITLDDVYRDAGLDKLPAAETKQEAPAQKVAPKVEPSTIPDPYDSENFKAFLARQAAGTTELTQAVQAMASHLSAEAQARAAAATRADIDKAVSVVNEVVGHSKPKVIEAAIDGMVREDARLKAIWDNRAKNPTAWSNALKVVSKQIAEDFSVKVDPALVAAQRARKDSQRQMATTSPESNVSAFEERLGKAQGAEFDMSWQQLVSGGN
jgi:hypothetical protein